VATVAPAVLTLGVRATVTGACFGAGVTVTATLFSTAIPLGTTTTDASGRYSLTFVTPTGVASGTHHIVVTGLNPLGGPHTSTATVSVAAALARTGLDSARLSLQAILLLSLGVFLVCLAGFRRLEPRRLYRR
jgi:hypothetical protein